MNSYTGHKGIRRISDTSFKVPSDREPGVIYLVTFDGGISLCTCKDFTFRQIPKVGKCKHIKAVERKYPEVKEIKTDPGYLKFSRLSDLEGFK